MPLNGSFGLPKGGSVNKKRYADQNSLIRGNGFHSHGPCRLETLDSAGVAPTRGETRQPGASVFFSGPHVNNAAQRHAGVDRCGGEDKCSEGELPRQDAYGNTLGAAPWRGRGSGASAPPREAPFDGPEPEGRGARKGAAAAPASQEGELAALWQAHCRE